MQRIGVRELRQNASRYLALVKAGETVEVTGRGELVALATGPSGRLRSPHPIPIAAGELANQELLDAELEDRL